MIDPGTAILISAGLSGVGGLLKSNKMSREQLAEQAREFNLSQQFTEEMGRTSNQFDQTKNIGDMQRRIEQAPMRDKALYMLNQRLGMTPQSFQPRDMANPGSPGAANPQGGGIDSASLQSSMGRYRAPNFMTDQAGSGGVDPRIYHQMMARLGLSGTYGNQSIGDVPIQKTTYGAAPAHGPQTGQLLPNGATVNPPGTTPWGTNGPGIGGTTPGSTPMGPPPVRPQLDPTRRTRR